MNPVISLIVPVYNASKLLPYTLDSILAQTYRPFELILVDDGSQDGSGDLCDRYAAEDERIVVIHTANRGVSSARNAGLECARGEYVTFCDSDDLLSPEFLEHLHSAIEASGADLACSDRLFTDFEATAPGSVEKRGRDAVYSGAGLESLPDEHEEFFSVVWAKLFRLELVRQWGLRFHEKLSRGEDVLFICSYASQCRKIAYVDESLYHYRIHAGSLMHRDSSPKVSQSVERFLSFKRFWERSGSIGGLGSRLLLDISKSALSELLLSRCGRKDALEQVTVLQSSGEYLAYCWENREKYTGRQRLLLGLIKALPASCVSFGLRLLYC